MGAMVFLGSGVKEREKIDGPWVMECEKIDGPKAMKFEKIVGPRVKKHANSFWGERPTRNENDQKSTSTSPVSSPKWYP